MKPENISDVAVTCRSKLVNIKVFASPARKNRRSHLKTKPVFESKLCHTYTADAVALSPKSEFCVTPYIRFRIGNERKCKKEIHFILSWIRRRRMGVNEEATISASSESAPICFGYVRAISSSDDGSSHYSIEEKNPHAPYRHNLCT